MTIRMRHVLLAAVCIAASSAAPQEPPVLLSGRPDIVITVKKSDVVADYVRLQALNPDYPADVLRAQIEAFGRCNGTQIRGLDVTYAGSEGPGRILTATFATDNLMNVAEGTLELNAFAKAFAGAEAPYTVSRLAVMYEGFVPKPNVTVAEWDDSSVEVSSHYDKNMKLVDYRVTLKTQDPEKISIPKVLTEPTKTAENPSSVVINPWSIAAVVGGAALLGVLVYFVLRPKGQVPPVSGPG